jgi:hypothetical protein
MRCFFIASILLGATAMVHADPPKPLVLNPHVTTDKSVDCSTVDSILADLIEPGMTDEQRVIAVFNWIRLMIVHGDGPKALAYDFHKMIHVMGNGSCLRQTTPMAYLLKRLGYESRSWTHNGHHMMEVKYGGKWHCFDPHMTFYVYDRGEPRSIASVEQLRADATLADDAVKEDRACPGYLLCGDKPSVFGPGGRWRMEKGWPKLTVKEPFGQFAMPRGMSCRFTWQPGEHYWQDQWKADCGFYHTCGPRRDLLDVINRPWLEAHGATIGNLRGKQMTSHRHWASGVMVYLPDVQSDHHLDAVVSRRNISHDSKRGLTTTDPAQPGNVVFAVPCPYVLTWAKAVVDPVKGLRLDSSIDGGKSWQAVDLRPDDMGLHGGEMTDRVNGAFGGLQLRLHLPAGTSLRNLMVMVEFQHNPPTLPYLVPGRNVVKVQADRFGAPLAVEWKYAEGPRWDTVKTASKTLSRTGTFEIDVEEKSGKYPRNLSLTLTVAP